MSSLFQKHCQACEGGVPPLDRSEIDQYLRELDGWELGSDTRSIERRLEFKNFMEAIKFVNQVAELAELESHHPDIEIFGWNKVRLRLVTHAAGGLTENDFILAAKINLLIS